MPPRHCVLFIVPVKLQRAALVTRKLVKHPFYGKFMIKQQPPPIDDLAARKVGSDGKCFVAS
ncbi:30S ribosomal protein S17 [Anopheles sinensis]|uniref:30S ribosomal protein S17 n=1 Tax=Anopheles sinensis TaxID=74873 RepID=A0A084WRM0_ANOSI|nr:30S ribosomal protein S17 [Anopheles sinensis]